MSKSNKNIEQLKAITTIDNNVVVNAGAGTGKTKVLTDRYIEILERGNLDKNEEIESIVAITFTNKATQEMIERIRELIQEKIKNDNTGKWNKFYRDMEKSNISTIHGFCGNILREHPVDVNIDPYFEIADDIDSNKLLTESIYEVVYEYLESNASFIELLNIYDIDRVDNLINDFSNLYNQVRTYGVTFEDIRNNINSYIDSVEYDENELTSIKSIVEELVEKFRSNSKLVKYSETKEYHDFLSSNYEVEVYDYLSDIIDNLGTSKVEEELQGILKEKIGKIMLSKEVEYKWMYNLVIDIISDIDYKYSLKKRKNGVLDYDDLQILVLKLFENDLILKKYQEKYKYFLIDEFQDTNELQKKIFYKLTSDKKALDKKNLFVVGDPKQSIYGFRGADVNIFYEVISDIEKNYEADNIITLKTNYRSVDTVMDFVNSTFINLMGVKYDALEAFNKSKNEIDIELILNDEIEVGEGCDYESHTHYEAEMICIRIKELLKEGIEYKDMAMLFRSTTKVYEYENILKKHNIPFHNSTSKSYYTNQEIIDLISALKVISNQNDNLSFIGLIRSAMFGLNDDTVFKILQLNKVDEESNMMDNIKKVILDNELEEKEIIKLTRTYDIMQYLIGTKYHFNIVDLINELIDRTDYIASSLLKDDGNQLAANIYKFKDLTLEYYIKNNGTLDDYIDYLENIREKDESDESIISENDDVVKLMTIHSSKGLQFKVVFLPQMSSTMNSRSSKFFYNEKLGLNIKNDISNGKYEQSKKILDKMEKEELLRVYYVGMTRAESILILGLQGRNSGIKKEILDKMPLSATRTLDDIKLLDIKNNKMEVLNYLKKVKNEEEFKFPLLKKIENNFANDKNLYSITQFMVFNECRRKYYLKYIWDINLDLESEEQINEEYLTGNDEKNEDTKEYVEHMKGSTKGNIVHEFCKIYRKDTDTQKLVIDSVNKFTDKNLTKALEILDPYVKNYINWYNEGYDEIYYEKPFYCKLENGYLYGIIDRVNINDEKIEVIDFKTNKINEENRLELDEYYKPQLLTYAYIAKTILKKELSKVAIVYLYSNDETIYKITDKILKDNIKKIDDFMSFVNNHNDIYDYHMTDKCNKYCENSELCKKFI